MSAFLLSNPHYGTELRADGHAEVWTDSAIKSKFEQYGWRCATKEDSYSNKTLIGNWNEERFDVKKIRELKPLPSSYAHNFETTYSAAYNRDERKSRIQLFKREPHGYPGHQPELLPPEFKPIPRSCSMIDYTEQELRPRAVCLGPGVLLQEVAKPKTKTEPQE